MEEYIGTVKMFAGNFAPRGWMLCAGQLLSIAQNSALFAIIGTTYGGDGKTTFALPDLRGRAPIGTGHGPGLSARPEGQMGGTETTTLTIAELPTHNHQAALQSVNASIKASSQEATEQVPGTNGATTLAAPVTSGRPVQGYNSETPDVLLNTDGVGTGQVVVGNTGGNLPFNNMQPFLSINFIICVEGIFPSRN